MIDFAATSECTFIFADPNTPSSKGTRFVIAFMPSTASNRLPDDTVPNAYIVVITDEMGIVEFNVTTSFSGTMNYNVTCDQPTRINFPATDSLYTRSGTENDKTISVIAKMGRKISVYVVSDEVRSTDGYVALPCDAMVAGENHERYEYIVLSTRQDTGGNQAVTLWSSEFVVITCETGTQVNVRPSGPITLPGVFNSNSFGPDFSTQASNWEVNDNRNIPADYTLTVGLGGGDYTGTVIRATKPIVLLSGHQCGQVPVGETACDHMVVQIPPHTTWGYTFLLNPLSERHTGDLYRFATLLDDTQITITCVDAGSSNPTVDYQGTLNSAQGENWHEFRTHESGCVDVRRFCCLQSTNPVVLAQYSYGYTVDQSCEKIPGDLGDPFFSLIPPVVQYLNNYKVVPIDSIAAPFTFKFLAVSVHADYFQPNNITFDDAPLESDPSQWQAIYCAGESDDICGYAYTEEINNNENHIVRHESENAALFVHVYGFSPQNSYAIVGGMELQLISGQSHN